MFQKENQTDAVLQALTSRAGTPKLYEGKESYIGFFAFDPAAGKMRRKKIKLNFIKSDRERKLKAKDIINRLKTLLADGWNPWISQTTGDQYSTFESCCNLFLKQNEKMFNDGQYEPETFKTFKSQLSVLINYNNNRKEPIKFVYQYNKKYIGEFLEHIYMERNASARTRNNYLDFTKKFATWLVEKDYLNASPASSIKKIVIKKSKKKIRSIIENEDMIRLFDYLEETNKHYLLACYLQYYCMIRPKEMSYLQIKHLNISEQTIFIPGEISKNDCNGKVTIPEKVLFLMIDLKIFDNEGNMYLFSLNFKPGYRHIHQDQFRKYWIRNVRKNLEFPEVYQFYSLKDTGITSMLRSKVTAISVRDQSRHSSLDVTGIYTPDSNMSAPPELKKYDDIVKL